jgi:hypothetical protein
MRKSLISPDRETPAIGLLAVNPASSVSAIVDALVDESQRNSDSLEAIDSLLDCLLTRLDDDDLDADDLARLTAPDVMTKTLGREMDKLRARRSRIKAVRRHPAVVAARRRKGGVSPAARKLARGTDPFGGRLGVTGSNPWA